MEIHPFSLRNGNFMHFKKIITVSLTILSWTATTASYGWEQIAEEKGIRVYQKDGDPPVYKAEGVLDANLLELLAVMSDIKRRPDWIENLVECKVLEGDPETRAILYSHYRLPWPATDRDIVIESIVSKDIKAKQVNIVFRNTTHPDAPEYSHLVRIPYTDGKILFKDIDRKTVFVDYEVSMASGGWLPNWMVRIFSRIAPTKTLRAMQKQIDNTKGLYAEFLKRHRY
jgi:hypothetical protein